MELFLIGLEISLLVSFLASLIFDRFVTNDSKESFYKSWILFTTHHPELNNSLSSDNV